MLVRALGLRDYKEVWDLQKKLIKDRAAGNIPDTLILVEHHPVYTIGRASKQRIPPELPYPLHVIERGGDITYHGPGQLVGYPIMHLGEWDLGPRAFLRTIEEVLIRSVEKMGGRPNASRPSPGSGRGERSSPPSESR